MKQRLKTVHSSALVAIFIEIISVGVASAQVGHSSVGCYVNGRQVPDSVCNGSSSSSSSDDAAYRAGAALGRRMGAALREAISDVFSSSKSTSTAAPELPAAPRPAPIVAPVRQPSDPNSIQRQNVASQRYLEEWAKEGNEAPQPRSGATASAPLAAVHRSSETTAGRPENCDDWSIQEDNETFTRVCMDERGHRYCDNLRNGYQFRTNCLK